MNTKWLDDLWYALHKDYGTEIVYTRIGKADVNYETGQRADVKTSLQIPAVFAPIGLYEEYLQKTVGATDRASSRFLVRKCDIASLGDLVADDYIIHANKRYMSLDIRDHFTLWSIGGVATPDANTYQVLNVGAFDQLGLGDGSS
jgi:hypothetical protein